MIIHDDEITTEQYELLIDEQCDIENEKPEIRDSVVEVFGGQFSMGVIYYDN